MISLSNPNQAVHLVVCVSVCARARVHICMSVGGDRVLEFWEVLGFAVFLLDKKENGVGVGVRGLVFHALPEPIFPPTPARG